MVSNYGGYMGRILLIDLAKEASTEYPWTDAQREETLGGKILANRILLDHLTGEEDPFSEENWLIVSTGPLTGTGAPASVRFEITALSPKTGKVVSSNCGGSFGLHLKKAGFDAIILKDRCVRQGQNDTRRCMPIVQFYWFSSLKQVGLFILPTAV